MPALDTEKQERLFIGVPISAAARGALSVQLTKPIPGKPVPAENWHFTLRFLGSTGIAAREKLVEALRPVQFGPAFEIAFDSLGAFPNSGRARVLWVGVGRGREKLEAIADQVEAAVLRAGFEKEKRRFKAHLTIARVDPPHSVAPFIGRVGRIDVKMRVDHVVLYRSELGRPHSRYVEMETFSLK